MKHLTPLTAFLVFLIAAAGFALSYNALYQYAFANGINNSGLTWLWPLVIDGFMIVISLSILRASLNQEPVKFLWFLAIVATVVSIVFNVAHAPATFAGRAVATVPPLAMFAAFETFIKQIRCNAERKRAELSLLDIVSKVTDKRGELRDIVTDHEKHLKDIAGQVADKEARVLDIETTIKDKRAELRDIKKQTEAARVELADTLNDLRYTAAERPDRLTERRDIAKILNTANVPLIDIASYLKVSQKTIERDLSAQNGKVTT